MPSWVKGSLLIALLSACFNNANLVCATPLGLYNDLPHRQSHPFAEFGLAGPKARDDKVPLRILGLGASIMSGTGSSTGNGLRKPLRDALRLDGYEVDMVGSRHGGTMVDYEHEAVPGDVLTQILARVQNSVGYKPNVVIINGGTNDGNGNVDVQNIGIRMEDILNALWAADGMADTCILLSTLIPTANANGAANRDTINSQYRSVVARQSAAGKCIYLADVDPGGQQWLVIPEDYLDGETPHVHPNDTGHKKMAAVFYQSLQKALLDGRVVAPGDFDVVASGTICDKEAGTGTDAGGLTQRGSGYGDGIYYHDSEEEGVLWTAESDWDRGQWKFARLFSQNYDDLLAWISETDTSQVYAVWANSADGKASFTQMSDLVPDLNCEYAEGVNFIDMNGDGLDDLVYIDADGNAYLSINQGDGDRAAGKSPTFKRVSDTAKIKDTEGSERSHVVLADIDGDGRGDYGVIDSSGNVNFWRNGWIDDIPAYWQALGQVFTGKDLGTVTATRFEDINGDGRDDWLWLDKTGLGYIYTNSRSCAKGLEGNGLHPAWRQGFYTGESSGPAYKGMDAYNTDDESDLRDRIHFARIYGQSTVFGNLPKQDYVFMQHTKLDSGKHQFQLRVWKNTGSGGTKLLADGNKYCNMMGHTSGAVDYVWAYSFGTMEMWANRGKGTITDLDSEGYWDYQGTIWTPPSDMNRKDLHLQDWDGDGACDIIYADPDSGAVQVWINNYLSTGAWDWTHLSNPAPELACSHKRGLGFSDLAVRFADITGNNLADYLCIAPDSTVTGFVHQDDDTWEQIDQIKVSITKDRANLRWADVNGDGVDDMLWIEKFSGDAYAWYNQGRGDPAVLLGSSFSWRQQDDPAYAGLVAGTCEYFADLNGDGYADEHYVLGTFNNEARTSLAPGCGLTDRTGDDDTMDGTLPTVPGSTTDVGTGEGTCEDGTSWRCLVCTNEDDRDLVAALLSPYERWLNAEAQNSVSDFALWYSQQGNTDGQFGNYLTSYYDSTIDLTCIVGGNVNINCWSDASCDNSQLTLAGYLVISSYVRIFRFYQSWWDALDDVLIGWGSISDDFVDTFVHKNNDVAATLNRWLLETVLEAVGGKLWGGFSKGLDLPEDNDAVSVAEGAFEDAYGQASDKLVEYLGLSEDDDDASADMAEAATQVISIQKDAVGNYTNWLLGGGIDAVDQFVSQVAHGTWFQLNNDTTDDARTRARKMTMAKLIPFAWSHDGTFMPVIIVSDNADDTDNPFSALTEYITADQAKSVRYNYNGKTFWAIGFESCEGWSTVSDKCTSTSTPFSMLDGHGDLDGSVEEWGYLSLEEMVQSSWLGYKLNGYANGYDITTADNAEHILDESGNTSRYQYLQGVLSPGYVSIPMCKVALARVNWKAGDKDSCDTFPCCSCDTYGLSGCDDDSDYIIQV